MTPHDAKNDGYEFRGFQIPSYMMEGLTDYVKRGVPPGGFLTAVICNDLKEAVGRADEDNFHNIQAYVGYFYNVAPAECWGSAERMNKWIDDHRPRFITEQATVAAEVTLAEARAVALGEAAKIAMASFGVDQRPCNDGGAPL